MDWPSDLRERWVEIITARARIDATDPRVGHHLKSEDSDVRSFLKLASNAPAGSVFPGYPIDGEASDSLSGTATRLAAMARSWITPASSWSGDQRLHDKILDGLETLLEKGYYEGAHSYGNWWDWEIGTPRPLADLLCIMRDELPAGMLEAGAGAIRSFVPDPTYSKLINYPTTGSNRVNTIHGALVAAVAADDQERMKDCVEALPEAWKLVERADGFYADGGFIQHINVAYTGSYGVELIRNAAPLLRLIENTELDTIDRAPLWDRVDDAFIPVMINGHMLDFVRGRAVSRTQTNGSTTGRATIGAIAQLAATAPVARREQWFAKFRQWSEANPSLDLLAGADIPGAVALAPVADQSTADASEATSRYFASMDRLVHRAPEWTAAIALCSNRIAGYEATEVENVWGPLTGNAMRYVFVDDDPAPYDDHFWATLDYSRPPGTTNHSVTLEPEPTRGKDTNVPPNEWTGGLVHGTFSVAAMHQLSLEGDAPECRRLIVGTTDRLIELVSDISTQHRAFSTVENRMFPDGGSPRLVVDGTRVHEQTRTDSPGWAHLKDVGGYLFLSEGSLEASVTTRAGSDRRIQRSVADIDAEERVDRRWATLDLVPEGAAAAWALLPGASEAKVREEARSASALHEVLQNDATGQVVAIGERVRVAAAWRSLVVPLGNGLEVRCPHALLVLAQRTDAGLTLRITEPTQKRKESRIRVSGRWMVADRDSIASKAVSTARHGDSTEIVMATAGRGGAAFTLSLRKG